MPVKSTPKKSSSPKKAAPAKKAPKKWSKHVTETSDALDVEGDIFKSTDPKKIALSLKKSAEESKKRKTTPFQSAMSMLNFYENRGGKNISEEHKKVLEEAKNELRELFGKEEK